MDRYLEAIGLAVLHADLELIPQAIRRACNRGVAPEGALAAVEVAAAHPGVLAFVRAWARTAALAWGRVARPRLAA